MRPKATRRIDGTTSAAPVAIAVAVTSHPSGPRTSGLPVQSRCDAATAIDANAVPASSMWMRPVRVSEDIPSGSRSVMNPAMRTRTTP